MSRAHLKGSAERVGHAEEGPVFQQLPPPPEPESALGFEARSSACQAAFCLEAIYSAEACEAKTV